jgi:hypothetical protein
MAKDLFHHETNGTHESVARRARRARRCILVPVVGVTANSRRNAVLGKRRWTRMSRPVMMPGVIYLDHKATTAIAPEVLEVMIQESSGAAVVPH